ncbi:MAG: hypothetical protein O7D29_08385, partial [Gemmatimonadetes bacterium]|nr:hypothetical protein [Gemmatimonadota bacterium]
MTPKFVEIVPSFARHGNGISFAAIRWPDFGGLVVSGRPFGQLKRDIATMADDLGPDLDQLLPQRGQRPMLHRGFRCVRKGNLLGHPSSVIVPMNLPHPLG